MLATCSTGTSRAFVLTQSCRWQQSPGGFERPDFLRRHANAWRHTPLLPCGSHFWPFRYLLLCESDIGSRPAALSLFVRGGEGNHWASAQPVIFNVPHLPRTECTVFMPHDAGQHFSPKISDLMATIPRHLLIFSHSVICLVFQLLKRWHGCLWLQRRAGGWGILAAGKNVFHTDLPESEACI